MKLTEKKLEDWKKSMENDEKARATIDRYMPVCEGLRLFLNGREMTKSLIVDWKNSQIGEPATVNVAISAVNRFLDFLGLQKLRLKKLKIQEPLYRPEGRTLTAADYDRLLDTAYAQGKIRIALIMETICSLGLRVSELKYVTVEALDAREVVISNKGRNRHGHITAELAKKLRRYCRQNGITSGPVFLTRRGTPIGRKQIWAEMKALCRDAGVEASKVFPHNLRHLFAVTYYRRHRNLIRLSIILGHASVDTTRIYLLESASDCEAEYDVLGLVRRSEPDPGNNQEPGENTSPEDPTAPELSRPAA